MEEKGKDELEGMDVLSHEAALLQGIYVQLKKLNSAVSAQANQTKEEPLRETSKHKGRRSKN